MKYKEEKWKKNIIEDHLILFKIIERTVNISSQESRCLISQEQDYVYKSFDGKVGTDAHANKQKKNRSIRLYHFYFGSVKTYQP